jgi:hypothetical protein
MQEQQFERVSSEAESASLRQVPPDPWNEGEKLRLEPPRHHQKGGISPLAIMVIGIVLLFVVVLLGGLLLFAVVAHSAGPHAIPAVPAPIHRP